MIAVLRASYFEPEISRLPRSFENVGTKRNVLLKIRWKLKESTYFIATCY